MDITEKYRSDIEEILSHRHDNGADYWATPDRRLLKGAPFTTLESVLYLLELGMPSEDEVLKGAASLILMRGGRTAGLKFRPPAGFTHARQPWPPMSCAAWGTEATNVFRRHSHTFSIHRSQTAAGNAGNTALVTAKRPNIPHPIRPWWRWTCSGTPRILAMMPGWKKLRIFCWNIGSSAGPSAPAITGSEPGSCRLSTHSAAIICFIMCTSCPIMKMRGRTCAFWRPFMLWNRKQKTGKSQLNV